MPAFSPSHHEEHCDVLVLGAGAAGLMAAIMAGQRGRRVIVLDHADRIGKKILISGGGRCNFTNLHCTAEHFLSANPHFARSALARYTPRDIITLVERHHIPWHEKTLGQLFCDRSARDITAMLEVECRAAQVRVVLDQHIQDVQHHDGFLVRTANSLWRARALVIATGGLSIPKMGATDLAYRIAGQFGLAIEPCRPALVPITWQPDDAARYADLTGLSTEVIASHGKARFREKLLFTHRGLSGPAILQISSYWKPGSAIAIDLAPGHAQGQYQGVWNTSMSISTMVAPTVLALLPLGLGVPGWIILGVWFALVGVLFVPVVRWAERNRAAALVAT